MLVQFVMVVEVAVPEGLMTVGRKDPGITVDEVVEVLAVLFVVELVVDVPVLGLVVVVVVVG